MIKVFFFAAIREQLGVDSMALESADSLSRARALIIEKLGAKAEKILSDPNILMARNHKIIKEDIRLNDGDELAFFPPVTGG